MNARQLDTSTASEGIRLSAMTLQQSEHRLCHVRINPSAAVFGDSARLLKDCSRQAAVCHHPAGGRARGAGIRGKVGGGTMCSICITPVDTPGERLCLLDQADTLHLSCVESWLRRQPELSGTVDGWRRTERRRRRDAVGCRAGGAGAFGGERRAGSRRRSRRDGERGARSLTATADGTRWWARISTIRRGRRSVVDFGDAARPFVGSTGQRTENRVQRQMGRDAGRGFGASVARDPARLAEVMGYESPSSILGSLPVILQGHDVMVIAGRWLQSTDDRGGEPRGGRRARAAALACELRSASSSRCARPSPSPNLPAVAEDSDSDEWETDDEHEVFGAKSRVMRRRSPTRQERDVAVTRPASDERTTSTTTRARRVKDDDGRR